MSRFPGSVGKGGDGCELRTLAEVLLPSLDCPLFPVGCQEHTQPKESLIHCSPPGAFRSVSESFSEEHHKGVRQPFVRAKEQAPGGLACPLPRGSAPTVGLKGLQLTPEAGRSGSLGPGPGRAAKSSDCRLRPSQPLHGQGKLCGLLDPRWEGLHPGPQHQATVGTAGL